jgi:hypothetical protein
MGRASSSRSAHVRKHTYRTADGSIGGTDDWGAYTVDEAALRHGAGIEEETTQGDVAYRRFPEPVSTRYRDVWLPGPRA